MLCYRIHALTRPHTLSILAIGLAAILHSGIASAQDGSPAPRAPAPAARPGSCRTDGFFTIFQCVFFDLASIAQKEPLIWLAAGGAAAGGVSALDDETLERMTDKDPEDDPAIEAGDLLGHAGLQFGAPLALYMIARAADHPGTRSLAVALVRAQIINAGVTRGLKLFPRARPGREEASVGHGSFPSGHTSAAFATATVLQRRLGSKAGIPAYALATFIGISRLQDQHYLSDVTFGAFAGIASGLALKLPSTSRVAITPMLGRGVTGVSLSIY